MTKSEAKQNNDYVKILRADQERLQPACEAVGIPGPALAAHTPVIDFGRPISELSADLGNCLKLREIFRQGTKVVAKDWDNEIRPMDSVWFRSWVENYVVLEKANRAGEKVRVSIGKDLAASVLAAGQFREKLRAIEFVRPVRMPVIRDGNRLELLPVGYDEETKTWTKGEVEFAEDMDLSTALRNLEKWFGEWPWADGERSILKSENCAGVVGLMLGQFCDSLLTEGTKRPLGAFGANQAGSGKSTLVRMVLTPVHGLPAEADLPTDKQEFIKLLQTSAINRMPYLVIDDIGDFLKSESLNRFITSSKHRGRILGGQQYFTESNRTQVFVTGNDLNLTNDLGRRSVVVALSVAGEIQGRRFKFRITDDWLAKPETRAEMLATCWAIVREAWQTTKFDDVPQGASFLQTFERWSEIVQCCLRAAKFVADPLRYDRARNMMASDENEMRRLLATLGDEIETGKDQVSLGYPRIIDVAREEGLFEEIVGIVGDPEVRSDIRNRLGKRLQSWKGRQVPRKSDSRMIEFRRTRSKDGSVYNFSFAE